MQGVVTLNHLLPYFEEIERLENTKREMLSLNQQNFLVDFFTEINESLIPNAIQKAKTDIRKEVVEDIEQVTIGQKTYDMDRIEDLIAI